MEQPAPEIETEPGRILIGFLVEIIIGPELTLRSLLGAIGMALDFIQKGCREETIIMRENILSGS